MDTDTQEQVGARLRAERERLGLSQEAMATRCGVSRPTQYRYESGKQAPDSAYMTAAAAMGVNVPFVLAGKGAALAVKLSTRETALVDLWRLSTPAVQDAVLRLLKGTRPQSAKPRKSTVIRQDVSGQNNVVIGAVKGHVSTR